MSLFGKLFHLHSWKLVKRMKGSANRMTFGFNQGPCDVFLELYKCEECGEEKAQARGSNVTSKVDLVFAKHMLGLDEEV